MLFEEHTARKIRVKLLLCTDENNIFSFFEILWLYASFLHSRKQLQFPQLFNSICSGNFSGSFYRIGSDSISGF